MAKIVNNKIWELGYNLNVFDKKYHDEIKKRLSACIGKKIDLVISTNAAIVNVIKWMVISEIKVKKLTCDIEIIHTNDLEILYQDLCNRISAIPIDQNMPLSNTYSLHFKNLSTTELNNICYSDYIKSANKKFLVSEKYRLAMFRLRKFIKIPVIKMVESYSFEENGGKFFLTSMFKFQVCDFIDVKFINNNKNNHIMVKTSNLLAIMDKKEM